MTQAQYLVFMLFKPVFSGLVIGEDGTGQFTKGSEFMQAKPGILSKSLGSHGMVIGETALNGTLVSDKYCDCNANAYGAMCDQNLEHFKQLARCGEFGVFDEQNTITGCSCRESIGGNATEYHGWYCEIHNR